MPKANEDRDIPRRRGSNKTDLEAAVLGLTDAKNDDGVLDHYAPPQAVRQGKPLKVRPKR